MKKQKSDTLKNTRKHFKCLKSDAGQVGFVLGVKAIQALQESKQLPNPITSEHIDTLFKATLGSLLMVCKCEEELQKGNKK